MSGAVVQGVRFDRRADACKHDGTHLISDSSSETLTICGECGTDLTIRTDPRLRAVIEKVYAAPPEAIAAGLIVSRIKAALS